MASSTMAYIRLQFVLGSGLSSRLIAWWGQGYGGFSHVDAVLSDNTLAGARSDSVGGKPPGFEIRPAGYEKWVRRAIVTISCAKPQAVAWEKFQRKQVGAPYDKSDILGFIIGKPISSSGQWICSAAQTAALESVQLLPKLGVAPQQVAPNALLLMVQAIGGMTVVTDG